MANMKTEALVAAGDSAVRSDVQQAVELFRNDIELSIERLKAEIFKLKQRVAKLEGGGPASA